VNKTRALLAGAVTALSLGFLALLARATFEGVSVGVVGQATLAMLFVDGFLIVASVFAVASQGRVRAWASKHCPTCGSLLFATLRSLDRRPLMTCFGCGHETTAIRPVPFTT